jgi:2-methylisocitrate lyase-like PEP mutase family enzyme
MEQREKAERFRALHEGEPFVIPNPWDAGSARVLEALGFEALATTSSGFAFTLGRRDGGATLDEALERVEAAIGAARGLDFPFTLTARAENHIRGNPDLGDTIARLRAYERAGADVLYAPGLRTLDEIRTVCDAVSRPVNVLARPDLTVRGIAEAGGTRISVGGALTWVAAGALAEAARRIRDDGDLSALAASVDLDTWLGAR